MGSVALLTMDTPETSQQQQHNKDACSLALQALQNALDDDLAHNTEPIQTMSLADEVQLTACTTDNTLALLETFKMHQRIMKDAIQKLNSLLETERAEKKKKGKKMTKLKKQLEEAQSYCCYHL